MKKTHQIVADGKAELERSAEFEKRRRKVVEEVRASYVERLAAAGVLRRLLLRARMRMEIRRRLDRLAPSAGCYIDADGGTRK